MLLSQYYTINMSILVFAFLIDPVSGFTSFLIITIPASCQEDSSWLKAGREILAIILNRVTCALKSAQEGGSSDLWAWRVLDL